MSSRPTYKQIARMAGVSPTTVSLVFQNHPRITERTRQRVFEASEQLGYRPDPRLSELMSYLRKRKPQEYHETLAFATPVAVKNFNFGQEYWRQFFTQAKRRAEELGYRLEDFAYDPHKPTAGKSLRRILISRGIRGVVFSPQAEETRDIEFDCDGFATVTFGFHPVAPRTNRVSTHHFNDMVLALEKLNELGYKRIGLVHTPSQHERARHMWRSAFFDYQASVDERNRIPVLLHHFDDKDEFMRWFYRHRPDVVVTLRYLYKEYLESDGLRSPDDFGFVHLNWIPQFGDCSGVNQHCDLLGGLAVNFIVACLQQNDTGLPKKPQLITLNGSWVSGKTVARQKKAEEARHRA